MMTQKQAKIVKNRQMYGRNQTKMAENRQTWQKNGQNMEEKGTAGKVLFLVF